MKVEEYLKQNQESIIEQCQTIAGKGSKAIVTVKENEENYIHKVGTVEEFTKAIPDNSLLTKSRCSKFRAIFCFCLLSDCIV